MDISLNRLLGIFSAIIGIFVLSVSLYYYMSFTSDIVGRGYLDEIQTRINRIWSTIAFAGIVTGMFMLFWGVFLFLKKEPPLFLQNLMATESSATRYIQASGGEEQPQTQNIDIRSRANLELQTKQEETIMDDLTGVNSLSRRYFMEKGNIIKKKRKKRIK